MKNLAVSVPQAHGCPFDDSTNLDRLSVRLFEVDSPKQVDDGRIRFAYSTNNQDKADFIRL